MMAEQTIGLLRQAEVELAQGCTMCEVCGGPGVRGRATALAGS